MGYHSRIRLSPVIAGITLLATTLDCQGQAADGREWTKVELDPEINFLVLDILDDTRIAVGGSEATLFVFQNGNWDRMPDMEERWNGTPSIRAIAYLDDENLWIGSASLTPAERGLLLWNGSYWSEIISPMAGARNQRVTSLFTDRAAGQIVAALQSGRLTRFDGLGWSPALLSLGGVPFASVHGTGPDNLWAVGGEGRIYVSEDGGFNWHEHPAAGDGQVEGIDWQAVYSLASDQTWMVGRNGEIAHWDGESIQVERPVNAVLRALVVLPDGTAYVVGSATGPRTNGTFLYHDGAGWQGLEMPFDFPTLNDIGVTPDGEIYAVGNDGAVLHGGPRQ